MAEGEQEQKRKGPGLMYIILMIVAAGCVIYGVYGLVTGLY
ncbi:MAG TPA: hypothetical protein O0X39_03690 [Methanocorpusculum sp.]|nr:hypothetical protein [Methanocorpusculum sp.]